MGETRLPLIAAELARIDGTDPRHGPPVEKHRKMARAPLQFLRGAAQLYYADLASGVLRLPAAFDHVPLTGLMGDCHFSNFGFFSEEGSHSDRIVWAPNDFDDAAVGPAVFDLARFVVSLFLVGDDLRGQAAGRYAGDAPPATSAPNDKACTRAARAFLTAYRATCATIIHDPGRRDQPVNAFPKGHVLRKPLEKARKRAVGGADFAEKSMIARRTRMTPAGLRFIDAPARFAPIDAALEAELRAVLRPYLDDDILDIVRRLGAGTGSVNIDRFYGLVGPAAVADQQDLTLCHVVEVKQQREAALIHHFAQMSPVNALPPAHLTVDRQRRAARRPDIVLDDLIWRDAHWLLRSRHNARLNVAPEALLAANRPARALKAYAAACGRALAGAHARGDRRSTLFEAAMVDALDAARDALIAAARGYAERTIADYQVFAEVVGPPVRAT